MHFQVSFLNAKARLLQSGASIASRFHRRRRLKRLVGGSGRSERVDVNNLKADRGTGSSSGHAIVPARPSGI